MTGDLDGVRCRVVPAGSAAGPGARGWSGRPSRLVRPWSATTSSDRTAAIDGRPATVSRPAGGCPSEVRRRRTLLAVMGLLLGVLALPLGGTGGHSHATGSALAETGGPVTYTVQPGDSLWSIAERVDPTG